MTTTISIVGVSGFSGIELVRLAAAQSELRVASVLSDRWQREPLGQHVRGLGPLGACIVRPQSDALSAARDADVVVLATPAEASAELAPQILALGRRVLDLSGAFRLTDAAAFAEHYRFDHPAPALLSEAHYALPQVPEACGDAPPIERARLVANPGCYATAAILALAPLLRDGVADASGLYVDGKSGVTGAGRKLAEPYLFTEVAENVTPYRVLSHQHAPEMELALSRVCRRDVRITFVPHLLPLARGLVATSFGRLTSGTTAAAVDVSLRRAYDLARSPFEEPIVEVTSPEEVSIQSVVRTPRARLGGRGDSARRSFAAVCAIDNLLKGAASQALENLLRMTATSSARS